MPERLARGSCGLGKLRGQARMDTGRKSAAGTERWHPDAALSVSIVLALFLTLHAAVATAADEPSTSGLSGLSIEDLAKVDITSVSKTAEPLSDAPAAIYVITRDDIVRSGATSIPEMLRLAPNLEVAQATSSSYSISARGFNGSLADKLLVLIDGRSVYSPLYAGVFWDMQDVLPENIERIEVISGPGATLWGANAVNGVINIITRTAADTQGGVLDVAAGTFGLSSSLQYGGKLNDEVAYRVYGERFERNALSTSTGANAHDSWWKPQGGFRFDWTPSGDTVTVEGDVQHATERQFAGSDMPFSGRDLNALWQHRLDNGAMLQVQTYYDHVERSTNNGGLSFFTDTYNLDVQHSFALGSWNDIVLGAGDRVTSYLVSGTPSVRFLPSGRTLNLANAFVQDTISLPASFKLTVGAKLEKEPYAGLALMPSARLAWKPFDELLVWSAASRAVRAPTPLDRDIIQKTGSTVVFTGGPNFLSEQLNAYELGVRVQPLTNLSLSVSTFYDVYTRLRTIELPSNGAALPLIWGNMMEGDIYGVETWGSYRVTDWWRLAAGLNVQHEQLRFKTGSSGFGGLALAGNDPNYQASLRSSINFTKSVAWQADWRYVGALHTPRVPSYTELNMRLGWNISPSWEVAISGFNLLHARHEEFSLAPISEEPVRSFLVSTKWRF
ncbi:MAG: TonB-dependent receptor plug domain-containing protein [Alphaproteobacteria bacterium]